MYLGNYAKGAVVRFGWNSSGANGASLTPSTPGTIFTYKDGDTASESSAGITDTRGADSLAGVHFVAIDTANAFYTVGSEYTVVLKTATIDGQAVNAVLGHFSLQRRTETQPVVGLAQAGAAGSVTLPAAASATDGLYVGATVSIVAGTGAGQSRFVTGYVGSTKVASVDPNWTTAPDTTSVTVVTAVAPATTTAPMPVQVAGMNANVITASAVASGALTAAKFAAGAFDAVWTVSTRSLTTFGTLVTDVTTAVWAAATRTLTSAGSLATDVRNGLLAWEPFTGFSLARLFRVLYATQRGNIAGATGTAPIINAPDNSGTITSTIANNGDRTNVADTFSNTP